MNTCRHCHCLFNAKDWQIAKSDFECDSCRRARQSKYRAKRKAEGNPVVSGKMPREYHHDYETRYFNNQENKERRNALMRAYTEAGHLAEHRRARMAVRNAIQSGLMIRQPCQVCGISPTQAHHDDYSSPLNVLWFCQKHHAEHHAKATGGE